MAVQKSIPNSTVQFVEPSTGIITQPWFQFFAQLIAKPQAVLTLNLTGSPFNFTAASNGNLVVTGGTVSSIALTRARVVSLNMGITSGSVPMSQGDSVAITYSALPSVSFIPN
jgi:hypothetical protein